ncbi:hypothetical protein BOTBODRAFT_179667 [Botryobasidium botryosum FD-172 SS1]|uniref:Uncharacterized protein n=1 Tax=Botryobasidium botryosum (strain FD-172 SS1) TaxID=930990 RepID=A0A067LZ91_BOTB1|nr:hypothetical protein BOTBODRAFT_179667 [Botryobasidium botryosum FD-172 SS1]
MADRKIDDVAALRARKVKISRSPRIPTLAPLGATSRRNGICQTSGASEVSNQLSAGQVNDEGDDHDGGHNANALFDKILRANVDGGKYAFDEGEVVKNTFILPTAGRETTARTTSATLTLLRWKPVRVLGFTLVPTSFEKRTRKKGRDVVLKKAARAIIDVVGMHYNPRHSRKADATNEVSLEPASSLHAT